MINFFKQTLPICHWSEKQLAQPQTHTIGWLTVAVLSWSGFSNKQSYVLKAPLTHSVYSLMKSTYEIYIYIYIFFNKTENNSWTFKANEARPTQFLHVK